MLALASPALLVILLLIVLPVGWLAWQSIYHDGFTLENYRRIFSEAIYWRSFTLTFQISLLVTVLALLLGYPIAYAASVVPASTPGGDSGRKIRQKICDGLPPKLAPACIRSCGIFCMVA